MYSIRQVLLAVVSMDLQILNVFWSKGDSSFSALSVKPSGVFWVVNPTAADGSLFAVSPFSFWYRAVLDYCMNYWVLDTEFLILIVEIEIGVRSEYRNVKRFRSKISK